ncbi:MAG: hypothetical protein J0M17_06980 [Planctomycetes bacterium]|nr:hypothetical protein [Planctomycetota bacterium]
MRTILLLTLAIVFTTSGCFTSNTPQDWSALLKPGSDEKDKSKLKGAPKLDIVGQSLGNSQEVSLSANDLLSRVAAMVGEQRFTSAARTVQRHPDAALEWLRADGTAPNREAAELIARVHDRQCLGSDAIQTWDQLTADRITNPAKYHEYREARQRFESSLPKGQVDFALDQKLAELAADLKSPLLEIDALQLEGTAHMLNERPLEAVAMFDRAATIAARISPYQATYLLLLRSDAERRAGDYAKADATWNQAVAQAGRMLIAEHPVMDPVLWERLGYLRPIEQAWPLEVIHQLHRADPLPGIELPDASVALTSDSPTNPAVAETVIWNAVGRWYLDRNHSQSALVAFKRAESAATTGRAQQWLRLRQARSLVQLDQTGPATAILVSLATDKASAANAAAHCVLGSLRLKNGQLQQGLGLLRKGIERDGNDWPQRAEAEADLGLAFLMSGEKTQGLRYLHQAQQRFSAQGDFEGLALALENEIAFLENSDGKADARAVKERLTEMERGR